MIDSLYIASSGMNAQQRQIDVIANNIANVNTSAYKKTKLEFSDIYYTAMRTELPFANEATRSSSIGGGVAIAAPQKVFTDGSLKQTNSELDVAISGNGFYEVLLKDGTYAYTRSGSLKIDRDGILVDKDGNYLSSMIQIPADAENLIISQDGTVSVKLPREANPVEIGQLDMAVFVSPGSLEPIGNNFYVTTQSSGDPIYGKPGDMGIGILSQGYVEASNVDYIEELSTLVLAQRAFEMSSKMVQASDQIMGIINNLYRA